MYDFPIMVNSIVRGSISHGLGAISLQVNFCTFATVLGCMFPFKTLQNLQSVAFPRIDICWAIEYTVVTLF
jgi:hypothetical protein